MQNNSNDVHVSFIIGKARVAPLKQVTIPRLEVTAAVLAVRVDTMLRAELQLPPKKLCFWTDSTSVLRYIKNRISTIRRTTDVQQWRYVHTTQNPADKASRGFTVDHLLLFTNRKWIDGPEFLWKKEEEWPKSSLDYNVATDDPEVKKLTANAVIVDDTSSTTHKLITYFSD